jgi:hypothetical protein
VHMVGVTQYLPIFVPHAYLILDGEA